MATTASKEPAASLLRVREASEDGMESAASSETLVRDYTTFHPKIP
jgi:hypothetical protein